MRKKGFTLIEVLGTIIVLALITLIAVPLVLDSIEKARRGAFKDSVYQAFQEMQYYLVKNNLEEIPDEGIDVTDIDFKNNIFISGRLILNESGNIQASNVGDGKYCAIGEKDDLKIYDGECDLSIPTCELNTKELVGMNGWYGINPLVVMHTMPVKSGFLTYGIGMNENYDYTVSGVGKVGTAEYQTIGDNPTTVYCYVKNVNGIRGSNEINIQIDKTAPTASNFSYSISGKNLTVVASGLDNESGISMYQFSIDGGATWTNAQTSNTYTYTNLQPIIYDVRVRVYNGTYVESQKEKNLHRDSDVKKVSMAELETPTYSHKPTGWTTSNVDVTVHFNKDGAYLIKPSISVQSDVVATTCSHVYNGTYTCNGEQTRTLQGGVWYRVESSPTLAFTENGSIIAQVSDGLNYKSASAFNISNIDRVKPVAYAGKPSGTLGENGWYKTLTLQVGSQSSGASGISNVYYCITTGSTCNPTTSATNGQRIAIGNNNAGQRICTKVVSGSGVESDIVCSDAYKVDNVPPTANFTLSGNTATVTCSDNYGINGSNSGTSWTLSGTNNQTMTYVCKDSAGNTYNASYTFKYNACLTGSNTCQGGYDQVYSACATGSPSTCQGGYEQVYNSCKTGSHNECVGGNITVEVDDPCASTINTCQPGCSSGTLNSNSCVFYKTPDSKQVASNYSSESACKAACGGKCAIAPSESGYTCPNVTFTEKTCSDGYTLNSSKTTCYKYDKSKYNACATGSPNTCVAGKKTTTQWSSCAYTKDTCQGGYENGNWNDCLTQTENTCQPGYVNGNWNTCKTGSNTCQGGFKM